MSKMFKRYNECKEKNNSKLYLFRCGMFYIFIDSDAKLISKKLNLKLTKLNDEVMKCGFPVNSFEKYSKRLSKLNLNIEIVDNLLNNNEEKTLSKIIKEIDFDNINFREAYYILYGLRMKIDRHE